MSCQKDWFDVPIEPIVDDIPHDETEYIAVFGDIQYYTNPTYINLYNRSIAWILAQQKLGIKFDCVLHTGDVTQKNEHSAWELFHNSTHELADSILYVSMIGDHDYTWDGQFITSRESTHFNDYVGFPNTLSSVESWFESGRMENIVIRNTIHGERYDLLVLEFGPRPEVLEWANDWVSSHPEIKYILMNHEYLESDGGRRTDGLKCAARLRNCSTFTTPEQVWNDLVKCNDNIICVLCGHVGGLYAVTMDTNDFGHEVPQIQHNIQSPQYRYDNWLMLWEFPAESDSANVFIYNTQTGHYYDNANTLFKFKYREKTTVAMRDISKFNATREVVSLNGIHARGRRSISIVQEDGKTKKVISK